MNALVLEASKRDQSQKNKSLRASGLVPAVYYGRGQSNIALQINYQNFRKIFTKAGENTIVELSVDGKNIPVLIHEVQNDPISDEVSHVDFIHVDMKQEVTTTVKVIIVGESPAVKNLNGILDQQKHEIKIKCLPKDLIHSVEVDVSSIVDFHTSIHVKDLKVPGTIKVLDNPEDTVVTATPQKVEKEETPAAPVAAEAGAAPAAGATPEAGAAAPQSAAPASKEQKK